MKRYTETVVDWMIRQNVINEKEKNCMDMHYTVRVC